MWYPHYFLCMVSYFGELMMKSFLYLYQFMASFTVEFDIFQKNGV